MLETGGFVAVAACASHTKLVAHIGLRVSADIMRCDERQGCKPAGAPTCWRLQIFNLETRYIATANPQGNALKGAPPRACAFSRRRRHAEQHAGHHTPWLRRVQATRGS